MQMHLTFADKYSVSASARIDDQTCLVHKQTTENPLYSFGASWDITKKIFNVNFINHLKLRATTGTNGNIDKNQ